MQFAITEQKVSSQVVGALALVYGLRYSHCQHWLKNQTQVNPFWMDTKAVLIPVSEDHNISYARSSKIYILLSL